RRPAGAAHPARGAARGARPRSRLGALAGTGGRLRLRGLRRTRAGRGEARVSEIARLRLAPAAPSDAIAAVRALALAGVAEFAAMRIDAPGPAARLIA